jgi:trehalose 6-phosphate synthase/phosphatase
MLSDRTLDKCNRLVIVSYRLPVKVIKENGKYTVIWNNSRSSIANFRSFDKNIEKIWIGTLEENIPSVDKDEVEDLLYKYNCIPVFIDKKLEYKFYNNFCKELLWPVLHYSVPLQRDVNYSKNWQKYWGAYLVVNTLFTKKITIFIENKSTLVWIHNYHLFLVPNLLRKRRPSARIGFFIHTVFPSSDVFRCIPEANSIMHSILSCDLIGFNTYDYARHFISCCRRLLYLDFKVLENGELGYNYNGRNIGLKINHLGINSQEIIKFGRISKIKEIVKDLNKKYLEKKIILSIDTIDIIKGGVLKLQGFNYFLDNNPDFRNKVVLFEFLLEEKHINIERRKHIYEEIEDIKRKHGNDVIKVINYKNDLESLMFLISICKISCLGLFSSYWDGLNIFPYEYTVLDTENPGCIILSQFMGCYRCLPGVLSVNPLKLKDIASNIYDGLTMNLEKRKALHTTRYNYVLKHDFNYWANDFVTELFNISRENSNKKYMEVGWGSNTRLIALDMNIEHLSNSNYIYDFNNAEKRLILLDYGGTLVERHNNILLKPKNELLNYISTLILDKRNIVMIVSGQSRKILEEVFGKINNIGLVAEKGAFVKFPNSTKWINSYKLDDIKWVSLADKIIENYTDMTPGSYKELKETYLLWNYEKSEPEYGKMKASELSKYLSQIFENENIVINQYETCRLLEIRLKNISKANAAKMVLGYFQSQLLFENLEQNNGFIMAIGNDISDDNMFTVLSSRSPDITNKYTVTIGLRPSTADYYLDDVVDVTNTLQSLLSNISENTSHSHSFLFSR